MGYTNRQFQSAATYTPPAATDPVVDNTTLGDVQAIKELDPTAGSTTPLIGQKARAGSKPVALSTEDAALLADLLTNTTFNAGVGAAITGQSLEAGGSGILGWLASIRKAITDRLPAALVGGRLDVNVGNTPSVAQSGTWTVQPGNTANTTAWKVDGSAVTQPVSAASLPLPSGAATESTLGALNGKVTAAITSDYDTGAGTQTMQMLGVALPASGGAVAGGTSTNPIRTDPTGTTTQPVSGTLTANIGTSGSLALDATVGSTNTALGGTTDAAVSSDANGSINAHIRGLVKLLAGALFDSTNSLRVSLFGKNSANGDTAVLVGSDGRLSTNIAQLAGTTADTNSGNKSAGTLRVVIATDQPALTNAQPTKEIRSATPTQTSVASSASSVSLLASNSNRLGATFYNDSTAVLYLKLGATASATSYSVQIVSNGYYEVPFGYTGAIDGIWASANGNARITELTA